MWIVEARNCEYIPILVLYWITHIGSNSSFVVKNRVVGFQSVYRKTMQVALFYEIHMILSFYTYPSSSSMVLIIGRNAQLFFDDEIDSFTFKFISKEQRRFQYAHEDSINRQFLVF